MEEIKFKRYSKIELMKWADENSLQDQEFISKLWKLVRGNEAFIEPLQLMNGVEEGMITIRLKVYRGEEIEAV